MLTYATPERFASVAVDRLEVSSRLGRHWGRLSCFCHAGEDAALIGGPGRAAALPQILELALQGFQLLDAPEYMADALVKQRVDVAAVLLRPV